MKTYTIEFTEAEVKCIRTLMTTASHNMLEKVVAQDKAMNEVQLLAAQLSLDIVRKTSQVLEQKNNQ